MAVRNNPVRWPVSYPSESEIQGNKCLDLHNFCICERVKGYDHITINTFPPYLEFFFFTQQSLFLWSWSKLDLNKVLQFLNCHAWSIGHYCTVAAQHDNRYGLFTNQWSGRLIFSRDSGSCVFWEQVLQGFQVLKVPWITGFYRLRTLRTPLMFFNILRDTLFRYKKIRC